MNTSSEMVVKAGALLRQIEEASAKGFVTDEAMRLLYSLESTVDALMTLATAEFWRQTRGGEEVRG
jgi:hypothetical protein